MADVDLDDAGLNTRLTPTETLRLYAGDPNLTPGSQDGHILVRDLKDKRETTVATSAAPTPNADTTDFYSITALAAAATFGAPTGTPTDGQELLIRVKDNATARALTWNAIYRAAGADLPTTTTISTELYVWLVYNAEATKWDCWRVQEVGASDLLLKDRTPDPASDHAADGQTVTLTAGETLAFGEAGYIKSDGKVWKADADGTAPSERAWVIALEAITADTAGSFALPGSFVRDDTWAWTVGNPVYLSATAGALTQTAPDPAIVIGIATHADRLFFFPSIQDVGGGGGGGGNKYLWINADHYWDNKAAYALRWNNADWAFDKVDNNRDVHTYAKLGGGDNAFGTVHVPADFDTLVAITVVASASSTTEPNMISNVSVHGVGDTDTGGAYGYDSSSAWYSQASANLIEHYDITSADPGIAAGDTVTAGVNSGGSLIYFLGIIIEYTPA